MPTTPRLRHPFLGLALVSIVAACSGGTPAAPATPVANAAATSRPAPTPIPDLVGSPDAWLVVGRPGEDRLHVIRASNEEEMLTLPVGAPDEGWASLVTATPGQTSTMVEGLRADQGFEGNGREVPGAWRLPTIGLDPVPVGVSTNRSTVVLVEMDGAKAGTAGSTRFAVLTGSFRDEPRIIELAGEFEFDAISPDGSLLYVVEHLAGPPAGHYQVRIVETATGVLRPDVIVDKRDTGEAMAGWPVAQSRRADGMVFTLYRGTEHPFIHALQSAEGWAVCLDLPATGVDDADAALDWGLAPAPNGRDILAINATLGLAVSIDPIEFVVRTPVTFEPSAASGIVLAKFGHQPSGPVGRRVVASPDRRTIYAAGPGGIVALDAADLSVTGRFATGAGVDAIAVTPDASMVYALLSGDGRIVKIEARSGEVVGRVPSAGFDRLVAIVPY